MNATTREITHQDWRPEESLRRDIQNLGTNQTVSAAEVRCSGMTEVKSRQTRPLEPNQWEQQPDEPAKWFVRFITFRDLPPAERSVQTAEAKFTGKPRQALTGPSGAWKDACKEFNWIARAEAWDIHNASKTSTLTMATRERVRLATEETFVLLAEKVRDFVKDADSEIKMKAVLQLIFGKGGAGKAVADNYRTLFGEKHEIKNDKEIVLKFD